MGVKIITFLVSALAIALLIHKDRHLRSETVHHAAKDVTISTDINQRPYYTTGPFRDVQTPCVTPLDFLTRKKINSFVWNHYNHYRFEMTFVDIGYASEVRFKISNENPELFEVTEKIGFSLSEKFLDGTMNYDFQKPYFKLKVRQYIVEEDDTTVTTFNMTYQHKNANFTANLTHIARNKECFTSFRTNEVISHKCFGGIGGGRIRMERRMIKEGKKALVSNIYNSGFNLTRVAFDGLRGSGMHWNWVWGEASGFSKPEFYAKNHTIQQERYLALNFGHLNGDGEDFLFINNKIKPLMGVTFTLDEQYEPGTNITFTSVEPRVEANFNIIEKRVEKKDLGFAYIDMVIFYGLWDGKIIDDDETEIGFYEIAGIVETSDSFF